LADMAAVLSSSLRSTISQRLAVAVPSGSAYPCAAILGASRSASASTMRPCQRPRPRQRPQSSGTPRQVEVPGDSGARVRRSYAAFGGASDLPKLGDIQLHEGGPAEAPNEVGPHDKLLGYCCSCL